MPKDVRQRDIGNIAWIGDKGPVIEDKTVAEGVEVREQCQPE